MPPLELLINAPPLPIAPPLDVAVLVVGSVEQPNAPANRSKNIAPVLAHKTSSTSARIEFVPDTTHSSKISSPPAHFWSESEIEGLVLRVCLDEFIRTNAIDGCPRGLGARISLNAPHTRRVRYESSDNRCGIETNVPKPCARARRHRDAAVRGPSQPSDGRTIANALCPHVVLRLRAYSGHSVDSRRTHPHTESRGACRALFEIKRARCGNELPATRSLGEHDATGRCLMDATPDYAVAGVENTRRITT